MKYQCTESWAAMRSVRGLKEVDDVRGLGTFRVVLVRGSVEHVTVAVDDVGCGNRQLPTLVAIHKGQVDEGTLIDRLLLIRDAIGKLEMSRQVAAGIGEQRKAQFVLVAHEE